MTTMTTTSSEIARLRRTARERIVEQFGETLRDYGVLVVDCGAVGTVIVNHDGYTNSYTWLADRDKQMVKLAGQLTDKEQQP